MKFNYWLMDTLHATISLVVYDIHRFLSSRQLLSKIRNCHCKCLGFFVCLFVLAAAQNNASPGWEAKLVEFFRDKLKQTDAQTSVIESNETLEVLQRTLSQTFKTNIFFTSTGAILKRHASPLPEAQQPREVPLFDPRHVRSRVLHGSLRDRGPEHKGQSRPLLVFNLLPNVRCAHPIMPCVLLVSRSCGTGSTKM